MRCIPLYFLFFSGISAHAIFQSELTVIMVGSSRSLEFSNEKNMREDEKGDKNTGDNIELVVFSENDPEDPKNWSTQRKLTTVVILCVLSFCGCVQYS